MAEVRAAGAVDDDDEAVNEGWAALEGNSSTKPSGRIITAAPEALTRRT